MSTKNKKSNNSNEEVTQEDIQKALAELQDEGFFSAEEAEEISNLTKSDNDEDEESSEDEGLEKAGSKKKKATNAKIEGEGDSEDDTEDEDDSEDDDMEDDSDEDDSDEDTEDEPKQVVKSKKKKAAASKEDEEEDDDSYFTPSTKKGSYRRMKKAADGTESPADDNEYSRKKDDKGNYSYQVSGKAKVKKGCGTKVQKGEEGVDELLASEEVKAILKKNPSLSKAINLMMEENTLLKAENNENKSIDKVGVLFKAVASELTEMRAELKAIGEQPLGRKSAAPGHQQRFSKAEGEEGDDKIVKADGVNIMSAKLHRSKVLDLMETMSLKKGESGSPVIDDEMSKAMMNFELGGVIAPSVLKRIEKESGVKIIS